MEKIYFLFLLSYLLIIVSCSISDMSDNNKKMFEDDNLLPSNQIVKSESYKKFDLFPDAKNQSWLIEEAEKDFIFLGQKKKSIAKISTLCKNAVVASMWAKLSRQRSLLVFSNII